MNNYDLLKKAYLCYSILNIFKQQNNKKNKLWNKYKHQDIYSLDFIYEPNKYKYNFKSVINNNKSVD